MREKLSNYNSLSTRMNDGYPGRVVRNSARSGWKGAVHALGPVLGPGWTGAATPLQEIAPSRTSDDCTHSDHYCSVKNSRKTDSF